MGIVILICFIIIVKSFYPAKKKDLITENNDVDFFQEESRSFGTNDNKQIEPEKTTKNKWLYPADEFGKMEKDVVYESKTYQSGIRENNGETENLIIITENLEE